MKGNNPELWNKLLEALDEKLQLFMLEHMRRVTAYHFEDDILYIEPGSAEDEEYFRKDSHHQQLELIAQDVARVDRVKIRR